MKMNVKRLAALATMGLSMGMGAYAQPYEGEGHSWAGARMEHHRAQMAKFQEKRLAALKAKLQLNPNQEAAWATFAQTHQPPANGWMPRPDRDTLAKLRTPERLDEMQKQFDAHHNTMQNHMKQIAEATRQFYAQLTPEQQKVFDAETLPPAIGSQGKSAGRERP